MCRFSRISALATHLKDKHDIQLEFSEHSFSSFQYFSLWKCSEEEKNSFCYVKHGGSITNGTVKYSYFYCNHSGVFHSTGSGQRNVKVQNTSKIGATCIAHMKVEEDITNGSCKVQYCQTHCGHKIELAHIRLPESSRMHIMAQLKDGISIGSIMDTIHDVSLSEGVKRKHLIIRNISRMLNLANIEKHKNDQTSVSLWVQEAMAQEYNPVLIYKPQGSENAIVGNVDDMAKENFLLAVQTEFQRDAMKKFANGKAVCMDATLGTNVYDFLLITVMVIDTFGEGITVGWARRIHAHYFNFYSPSMNVLAP